MFRNLFCLMNSKSFNSQFMQNFTLPLFLFLCNHFFRFVTVTSYHEHRSQTVLLSLWDSFLANEGQEILSKLHSYPVIIARRVRVNNYNGLFQFQLLTFLLFSFFYLPATPVKKCVLYFHHTGVALGTWFDSAILVDPPIQEARELKNWYDIFQIIDLYTVQLKFCPHFQA